MGTEDRIEAKVGTEVRAGGNGTLLTPPISKTVSGIIAETRLITTEVGQADSREGGKYIWGKW